MKSTHLLATLAFVVTPISQAQDRQVLLEACGALKNAERRAKCFESVARMDPPAAASPAPLVAPVVVDVPRKSKEEVDAERQAATKAKYEAVHRAFTALRAATETSLSYIQYGPLIQAAATEVALVKPEARTDKERLAVERFERALNAYSDAATWWDRDISFYAQRGNNLAYAGGLPFAQLGLDEIVSKWGIPTRRADLFGLWFGVPRSVALGTMWQAAAMAVSDGREAILISDTAFERAEKAKSFESIVRDAKINILDKVNGSAGVKWRKLFLAQGAIPTLCGEVSVGVRDPTDGDFKRFISEVKAVPFAAIDDGSGESMVSKLWLKSCAEKSVDAQ